MLTCLHGPSQTLEWNPRIPHQYLGFMSMAIKGEKDRWKWARRSFITEGTSGASGTSSHERRLRGGSDRVRLSFWGRPLRLSVDGSYRVRAPTRLLPQRDTRAGALRDRHRGV